MINKLILLGHVGKDPDITTSRDGKKIARFSLATSDRWTDKTTGEKKEITHWHRIVVFNENLAGIVEQYVHKGSKLYVEGASQTRKWTDSGVEKYVTECVLSDFRGSITLLDKRENVPGADSQDAYGSDHDEVPPKQIDEEIPF